GKNCSKCSKLFVGAERRATHQTMKVGVAGDERIELIEIVLDCVDGFVVEGKLEKGGGVATSHARDDWFFACQRGRSLLLLRHSQPERRRGRAAQAIGIQDGIPTPGNIAEARGNPLKSSAS